VLGVPAWVLSSLLISVGLSATVAFGAQRLWHDSAAVAVVDKERRVRDRAAN
jgi:hypothetical protein